jgi:hypothetical protein
MPSLASSADAALLQRQTLGATPERMLREMTEAVEAMTAESPIVLALEDLHWSDYSTLDLIAYLARRRERAPLLLVATYRPVEVILSHHPLRTVKQELQIHDQCVELELEFLSEGAVSEYLEFRFPEGSISQELACFVHGHTDGNPLFVVNVADFLLTGEIVKQLRWVVEFRGSPKALGWGAGNLRQIDRQPGRCLPRNGPCWKQPASLASSSQRAVAAARKIAVAEIEESSRPRRTR